MKNAASQKRNSITDAGATVDARFPFFKSFRIDLDNQKMIIAAFLNLLKTFSTQ